MDITGYQIREALKMKTLELSTVQTQWDESLYTFEGETKETPLEIIDRIIKLEADISYLQTAQDYYNLQVIVKIADEKMTLSQAIKTVGGAGRVSKMWRNASKGIVRDSWDSRRTISRNKDDIIAEPTIKKIDALNEAKRAEKLASQLRTAIATGNTTVVAIDWVDEKLLN